MLKQLEKEGAEEEMYDQLACWCETNDKERTKAIADAEATIEDVFSHTFQQMLISVSETEKQITKHTRKQTQLCSKRKSKQDSKA